MTRQRLPHHRASLTVKFWFEGHEYRATASRFADDRIAEVFLDTGKFGSGIQEYANNVAILTSMALQHGVPSDDIQSVVTGPIQRALTEFTRIRP